MSRCVVCDSESSGLSNFRPDGRIAHTFHQQRDGSMVCDECNQWESEVMSDFYDSDLESEEDDGAFEDE